MLPLMLAVPFGPLLAWKRGDLLGAGQRLFAAVAFGLVAGSVIYYEQNGGPVMALFGIALGAYMIAGSLTELFLRSGLGKVTAAVAWRRVSGPATIGFRHGAGACRHWGDADRHCCGHGGLRPSISSR